MGRALDLIIFGSPSRYLQGAGAIGRIGEEIARMGQSCAVLADPAVSAALSPIMAESCQNAGCSVTFHTFSGECTDAEVDRIISILGPIEVIIALGGGKCIDAAKAVSHALNIWMVSVPTVASTDAPTSHNYVIYDENHRLLEVRKLRRNPALVLVDTAIIAKAPKHLFAAGIGDAIGKIYEVEACAFNDGINIYGAKSPFAAVALARACFEQLREHALAALDAVGNGLCTEAVERTVEATVLMSGLAFESGGLSVAHSMTRGLSICAKYANSLHGFQVAYANLVQLILEERQVEEIAWLCQFNRDCGLPVNLKELGGSPTDAELWIIAEATMTAPHMRHVYRSVTSADIFNAMKRLEAGHFAPRLAP